MAQLDLNLSFKVVSFEGLYLVKGSIQDIYVTGYQLKDGFSTRSFCTPSKH